MGIFFEEDKFRNWVSATFISLFITSLTWLSLACLEPRRVERIDTINIQTINNPNGSIQIITYKHCSKGDVVLNLNKHFGCQLNQGNKIKHTKFSTGPYLGISFYHPEDNFDKFEIVEAEK